MSVYSVNVYPSSTTIKTGNWYYGAYAVVNASSNCNTGVRWYSNNTSVATVNASSGYIYAKAPGTTRIYAQSTVDSSKKDYITVTVTSGTICVDSVTLNRSSISLEKGDRYTLSATVCPTNATNKTISWRSSNTSVATVSGGVVTAKARGYAYIYAEAQDGSGEYARCYVNVTEDILVTSVTVSPSSKTMNIGSSTYLYETVCPTNATNKCVRWSSNKTSVATVNPDTGLVIAQGAGTATITATAQDGSNKKGYCTITVNPPVAVTGVEVCPTSLTMNVGDIEYLCASITPSNATNQTLTWCSSNENVATVGLYTGKITAKKAGIVTITATTADGGYSDSCEVWVHGKTPVFLIHGRTSNSFYVWGAGNRIFVNPMDTSEADNNHYNSSINALSQGNVQYLYTNKNVQDIFGYQTGQTIKVDGTNVANFTMPGVFNGQFDDGKYTSEHPEGGNLAYYLKSNGYKENINLFVFNYPNEDAVVHSANKFKKYIENLISYVRTSGTNEMKACFYASKCDYIEQNHKINLVGHSMGGLVSRYYIENLGQDSHVAKLITICTPHWGSGYADASNETGIMHKLCDHDLDFNSAMYDGNLSTVIDCNLILGNCPNYEYVVTETLNYQKNRFTKYYAIAAIDYPASDKDENNVPFEMPTNYNNITQISEFLAQKGICVNNPVNGETINVDPKGLGDNMVGFLSQIGWTGDNPNIATPQPEIEMEKIFIDADTNGGNGDNIPIIEALFLLHNKAPHRMPILQKTYEYLED